MYQPYDKQTASTEDRIAWVLCQIIDDDAPMRWTRYRGAAHCIAKNPELMADLQTLAGRSTPTEDAELLRSRVDVLAGALQAIRQYGYDTLSGRTDGPDDRAWQRAAVREMTKRASTALAAGRSAPTPACAPACRKEDPVMLKFAGHKTMAQIKEQCEAQGVYLDLHAYHQGHDTICVGGPAVLSDKCRRGWAVYNVASGRFWGCTPEGVRFNSDSAEHDGEPWMQALLHFFMVPEAPATAAPTRAHVDQRLAEAPDRLRSIANLPNSSGAVHAELRQIADRIEHHMAKL